ncbi:MAG: helix-turn-helix domain-containing protein [Chloroflexota bacterium]
MSRIRRPELVAEAARRNLEHLARLGGELRSSRRRRRLTQAQVGAVVGVVQSTISMMERGRGANLSVDVWQRALAVVDRRLMLDVTRDPAEGPADAAHLRIQELVLGIGRIAGYRGGFELATRPADPSRSADVGLRSDVQRRLLLVECWNTIGDLGAAVRSTNRKLAEAADLALVFGGDRPYLVASCWVVRATTRNRALVARYPEVFGARFPASSEHWVRSLSAGREPPSELGLVWCDVAATRIFAWRRR